MYEFSSGEQGLVLFSILVFTYIDLPGYFLYINKRLVPLIMSGNFRPEMVLLPAFIGGIALPIYLF